MMLCVRYNQVSNVSLHTLAEYTSAPEALVLKSCGKGRSLPQLCVSQRQTLIQVTGLRLEALRKRALQLERVKVHRHKLWAQEASSNQKDQLGSLGCSHAWPPAPSSLRISGLGPQVAHFLDTRDHLDGPSGKGVLE